MTRKLNQVCNLLIQHQVGYFDQSFLFEKITLLELSYKEQDITAKILKLLNINMVENMYKDNKFSDPYYLQLRDEIENLKQHNIDISMNIDKIIETKIEDLIEKLDLKQLSQDE
jgi:hypothetical protein